MSSSISFAHGPIISSTSLSSAPILQGGDIVNITINISDYTLQDSSANNSSHLCQGVGLKGFLVVPLFLQLLSFNKESKVESSYTNCTPELNITQSKHEIDIYWYNTTWTSVITYHFQVLSTVYPSSRMNINATFSSLAENKTLILANFPTVPLPDNLTVVLKDTSKTLTSMNQMIQDEKANIDVSFILPSVTTQLTLTVKLPYYTSAAYFDFLRDATKVTSMSNGITSQRYKPGSVPLFTRLSNEHIAIFEFNTTSNTVQNGAIAINIGLSFLQYNTYTPLTFGNVSFDLKYTNSAGKEMAIGPKILPLKLSQPYLELSLVTVKGNNDLQAFDEVVFDLNIENPTFATEPSEINITDVVFPRQVNHTLTTTKYCDRKKDCSEVGANITSYNLSPGLTLKQTYTTTILPTMRNFINTDISLKVTYSRSSWFEPESQIVRHGYHKRLFLSITGGTQISSSSYISPNDLTQVVPEENVGFGFNISLPLLTYVNLAILVQGDGFDPLDGKVIIGEAIHNSSGPVRSSDMLKTSSDITNVPYVIRSPTLYILFPYLVNSKKNFLPGENIMSFQVTGRSLNANKNVRISKIIDMDNRLMVYDHIYLKLLKPVLEVTTTLSPTLKVNPLQEVVYTVKLSHSAESTSNAYGVVLEIGFPHDLVELDASSVLPPGKTSVVTGERTLSGSNRYNDTRNKILIYKSEDFNLNSSIQLTFKVKTVTSLPKSFTVKLPIFLSYNSLPWNHTPNKGHLFANQLESDAFLTFRPEPYVLVNYTSSKKEVDAGDYISYIAVFTSTAKDKLSAYELNLKVDLKNLLKFNQTFTCNRGVTSIANETASVTIGTLPYLDGFSCSISGFIIANVAPRQDISPFIQYTYYSTPSSRPPGTSIYNFTATANTLVASIMTNVALSDNSQRLLAGQELSLTMRLLVPECQTKLLVLVSLPVVSIKGTRFERQRRSVTDLIKRSRRSLSNTINVLEVIINQTSIKPDFNSTLNITHPQPNITMINKSTLQIDFGFIQNDPSPLRLYQGITMVLRLRSVSLPLILSGRSLVMISDMVFTGGKSTIISGFKIVGVLCKPLLQISKTVEIYNKERDSPIFKYTLKVSHKFGSPCDAYDIIIVDETKNVDVDRTSVMPKSDVVVSYPSVNVYTLDYRISRLKVGESASMEYKASFIIKEKDEKSLNLPARLSWKSIQLNSPQYNSISNLSACVERSESSKYKKKEITGFFALGIVLGFLIGLAAAFIIIVLIIKCCDTGKIASAYLRYTNKKSMTVLTGGSRYVFKGETSSKSIGRHRELSIVKSDESIIPILSLDNATQTEKELDSLDMQATVNLDVELEDQRQSMFEYGLSLMIKKLRVKREISASQQTKFLSKLKAELGSIGYKMSAEFKKRLSKITVTLKLELQKELKEQAQREVKERQETENKIKGLVDAKERQEILGILRKRHSREEQEIKRKSKLDLDVEVEKLRKEISISRRFAVKECQSKLLQELIEEGRINEERADELVREHFTIMAAIDKATDEERARRLVALEMRLAERRALALQKLEDDKQNQDALDSLSERQDESFGELIVSSNVSDVDVNAYRSQYRKDVEELNKRLTKDRQHQERKFHMKLTALKQKRFEDKVVEHFEEISKSDEEQHDKMEQVEIDCIESVKERQRLMERQRRELEDLEREADHEASEEVQKLHDHQSRSLLEQAKTSMAKVCRDMSSKGLDESLKNTIMDQYTAELARQQEAKDEKRKRNEHLLERRLAKLRKALENKTTEEVKEQEELRKKEEVIINELIVSQVVMSEEERDRILAEHEKNLVELESSLTLNKLRQRQKLEERLTEKRKQKMQDLEKQQHEEEKVKDYTDKILNDADDIELLKKHEQEKAKLLQDDENDSVSDLSEQVREDMMKERTRKLQEHQENISSTIAKLQIEKAKQISQMRAQQQILNQLQTNLVDELESNGVFEDPEAIQIVEKYKKDAKKVEQNLRQQKIKQEEDLKERLEEKLKERRKTILAETKAKETKATVVDGNVSALLRFRKAAVKARQEEQLNEMRKRMDKEKEQSLNQLRINHDLQRMRIIEEKNIQFIAMLAQKGKLKLEELEPTLKYLFPQKPQEYIQSLLLKIYGVPSKSGPSTPNKTLNVSLNSTNEMSQLEKRVRRTSMRPLQSIKALQSEKEKIKRRSKSKRLENEETDLPPVTTLKPLKTLPPLNTLSTGSPDSQPGRPLLTPISSQSSARDSQDTQLLDEMFGGSSEPDSPVIVKKRKKKKRGVYRDLES